MPVLHALVALLAIAPPDPSARLTIQEYAFDSGHCIVEFSIGFAFTHIKGRFPQTHGTILYDPNAPERSSVSVAIETNSLDTGWGHRDEHLRTDDFFDVEHFPSITFQSVKLTRTTTGWIATGPLTMHGVTKTISIPFRLVEPPSRRADSGWMMINAIGQLRLARKDFGIIGGGKHNSWFDAARSATVADTVDVSLEIEAYLTDAQSQRVNPGIKQALDRISTGGIVAQLDRYRQLRGTKSDAEFAPYFHGGDLVTRALIADGKTADAVALSRGLTEIFTTLHSAYLVHGFALAAAGDTRGAAQQYAKAREVFRPPVDDPTVKFKQVDDNWWYGDNLVRSALEWGRVREAVTLARVLTDIYGSNARAHVTLGLALMVSGDAAGARVEYARALQIDPLETRATEWQRRLSA